MKNKKLFIAECLGAIFIFLIGAFVHFGFEWTGKMRLFTCLFAVNESIWEHTKLTFWSPLIYGLIEYFIIKEEHKNFFIAKTASAIVTTLTLVILHYLIKSLFGTQPLPVHLIMFEISIIIGLIVSYNIINLKPLPKTLNYICLIIILAVADTYYVFSYNPPKYPFFYDAFNKRYGI